MSMTEHELRTKIAHIELVVRRLMDTALSGDFTSAFKGGGLEFAQLRSYFPGDDIRNIDWNSSAKMNKLMVKEFVQEKERTIIVALDLSSSLLYSSASELKKEYAHMIAAALVLIASKSNDKVGLLLFAEGIEFYAPPRKGRSHASLLVRQIFAAQEQRQLRKQSNLLMAGEFLASLRARGAIAFMVSDWVSVDEQYTRMLGFMGTRYEAIAVRITDSLEQQLPNVGVLAVVDPETGQEVLLDTRGSAGKTLNGLLARRMQEQKRLLRQYKIDVLDIKVGESFIDAMASFFHYRVH